MSEVSEIINSNFEKEEVNVEKKLKIKKQFPYYFTQDSIKIKSSFNIFNMISENIIENKL